MENTGNSPIILFDGVCILCERFVLFTIKKDTHSKFKFASLQSTIGQSLLKKFNLPIDDFDSFVFITGNNYFLKSTAVLQVLKELGGTYKLFYIFIIIPKFIRDFFYDYIAKKRYKIFGKRNACIVPTVGIKQRFLE